MKQLLITGIHTGLGRALAVEALRRGATVHAISRQRPDDLELDAAEQRLHFHPLDLRRFETIGGAVDQLLAEVPRLDLVVLNAGVLGRLQPLAASSLNEVRDVMELNVWSNKVLIDELMAWDKPVEHIVGISSGAAVNGSDGWGPYSISKAALNLMLQVYAREHADTHFTALAPGIIYTGMIDTILNQRPDHQATGRVQQAHQDGRIQTPEAAATAIFDCLPTLRRRESGAYVDIRDL